VACRVARADEGGAPQPAPGPPGRWIDEQTPPAGGDAWPRACSLRDPVCLFAAPGTSPSFTLSALRSAERGWETLTGTLAAPPPDPSSDGSWHVYLVPRSGKGTGPDGEAWADGTARLAGRDVVSRLDRGSSFALVDRVTPAGCRLDLALARAVARGSLLRAAPAMDPGTAIAVTEALALLATPCASGAPDTAAFQAHPERTPVDPFDAAFDRGAAMLFGWIDTRFGASAGWLLGGLAALSPTRTVAGSRWPRRPTAFDVMRTSLRDRLFQGSTFDDVVVRFAVDRASAEPPARAGWQVGWPEHPRRLIAPTPLAPLGAAYVIVDTPGRSAQDSLLLEADWEDYGRMRWVVVKQDARGAPIAEIPMGSVDKGTHASLTVESLEGTARVVVVAVDVGDTEAPFDPAAGEWEPHGWMLTLSPEKSP
jgi:hypothetical protein